MRISPRTARATLAVLSCVSVHAMAAEVYGGAATTGVELGVGQTFAERFGLRLEGNSLNLTRNFSTSDVQYDAKVKFGNAGVFADVFIARGFRLTAGALVGDRGIHGVARSVGNTIQLNGVAYPVAAGDSLNFEAKFPTVSPYIGLGWGHQPSATAGLQFYADVGVAIGRPEVTFSPSASLAAKVNPSDLASEQASAQDKANSYRNYPVVKIGLLYAF